MKIKFAILTLICLALGGCCHKDKIPTYMRDLYSSNAHDRNEAALGLAQCGSQADRAVSRLIQLLYDENVGVQSSAAYALREIDSPAARAALERASKK